MASFNQAGGYNIKDMHPLLAGMFGLGGPEVVILMLLFGVGGVGVCIVRAAARATSYSRYCTRCGRGLNQPRDSRFCCYCANPLA